ncbi:hypothetical protein ElyMa_006464000 [Elysia marginata]|uniref:Uncharacterized protein n=1 Tax=Elysia marginata TaxID=1093978 RepID=A0AAV4HY92_9GAST|nr:hypothetical protein ElyMa_006464000 [Elysia marginata]
MEILDLKEALNQLRQASKNEREGLLFKLRSAGDANTSFSSSTSASADRQMTRNLQFEVQVLKRTNGKLERTNGKLEKLLQESKTELDMLKKEFDEFKRKGKTTIRNKVHMKQN